MPEFARATVAFVYFGGKGEVDAGYGGGDDGGAGAEADVEELRCVSVTRPGDTDLCDILATGCQLGIRDM